MSAPIDNEKYNSIIKTSHNLFWKFGIRRVTVEEICREAFVSKMTFYRFFPNKTAVAKAVIRNIFDNILNDYRKLMAQNIPFEEKVRQQLIMKFEGTKEISAELVKDIYGDPKLEIFTYWESRTNEIMQLVFSDYAHAQEMGWIRKDIRLEFVQYFTNKMGEMASDENLQALYPSTQDLIMEIANFFFYGIFPRKERDE